MYENIQEHLTNNGNNLGIIKTMFLGDLVSNKALLRFGLLLSSALVDHSLGLWSMFSCFFPKVTYSEFLVDNSIR